MKILASDQVQHWLLSLAPDPKKRVRSSLRGLANGKGDIKALRGELEGFLRLRIGGFRIIYTQVSGPVIRLEYADTRDVIYETFLKILSEQKKST